MIEDDTDLAIPVFLRGASQPAEKAKRKRRAKHAPSRPKAAGWEKASLWLVFLMDQLPRFGSGSRRVWVLPGRKWVRVAEANGSRRGRISKETWKALASDSRATIEVLADD